MTKWEYLVVFEAYHGNKAGRRVVPVGFVMYGDSGVYDHDWENGDSIINLLDKLGVNGWEMCGTNTTPDDQYIQVAYYFKRPIDPSI